MGASQLDRLTARWQMILQETIREEVADVFRERLQREIQRLSENHSQLTH